MWGLIFNRMPTDSSIKVVCAMYDTLSIVKDIPNYNCMLHTQATVNSVQFSRKLLKRNTNMRQLYRFGKVN